MVVFIFLRLPAFALCENNVTSEIVKSHELEIRTLANLSSLEVKLCLQFLSYGSLLLCIISEFLWGFGIGFAKGRTRSPTWIFS